MMQSFVERTARMMLLEDDLLRNKRRKSRSNEFCDVC